MWKEEILEAKKEQLLCAAIKYENMMENEWMDAILNSPKLLLSFL